MVGPGGRNSGRERLLEGGKREVRRESPRLRRDISAPSKEGADYPHEPEDARSRSPWNKEGQSPRDYHRPLAKAQKRKCWNATPQKGSTPRTGHIHWCRPRKAAPGDRLERPPFHPSPGVECRRVRGVSIFRKGEKRAEEGGRLASMGDVRSDTAAWETLGSAPWTSFRNSKGKRLAGVKQKQGRAS